MAHKNIRRPWQIRTEENQMNQLYLLFAMILLGSAAAFSETIQLKGVVHNAAGEPVKGVFVKLLKAGDTTSTDSVGAFLISQNSTGIGTCSIVPNIQPSIRNGIFTFTISAVTQRTKVGIYTLNGKKIKTLLDENLKSGVYTIPIVIRKSSNSAQGLYLLRFQAGSTVSTFKLSPLSQTTSTNQSGMSFSARLVKVAGAEYVDTLHLSKNEYCDRKYLIESYDDSLGVIQIVPLPALPDIKNIGNEKIMIKPFDPSSASASVSISVFVDSMGKAYEGDSLLGIPVKLTPSIPLYDTSGNGIAVLLPLDLSKLPEPNNLNVFLTVYYDSISIPVHGQLLGDTLFVNIPFIDSNMVIVPTVNNGLVTVTSDDSSFIEGRKKTALTNPYTNWPAKKFWCAYNQYSAKLHETIKTAMDLDRQPTQSEIQTFIIKNVMLNAKSVGDIFREKTYHFRAPEMLPRMYPPQSSDPNSNSTYSKGPWYVVYLGHYPNDGSHEYGQAFPDWLGRYGIFIDYEDLKEKNPDSECGTVTATIAHEMMHSIIDGYDIDKNIFSLTYASLGIHDGIATVMGHTIDHPNGQINVRPNRLVQTQSGGFIDNYWEIFQIDYSLLVSPVNNNDPNNGFQYSNEDFFAYLGKKKGSMLYLEKLLENLRPIQNNPDLRICYLQGLNANFPAAGFSSLASEYTDFIRNRAYEHNPESVLRTNDPSRPYMLYPSFALPIPATISTSPGTVSIGDVPPFSSRAVMVDLHNLPASFYQLITINSNNIPINNQNLLVICYLEKSKGIGSKDNIIYGDKISINTANTPYATLLLINNSYSEVKNVQLAISSNIAPSIDFTALPTTGFAPLPVQFNAIENPDGGQATTWQWDFGDGNNSAVQNPSHTYNDSGHYSVRLIATNAIGADTTLKQWYITVAQCKLNIDFSATPVSGLAPLTVQFNAWSTDACSTAIKTWQWDFGDGYFSTEKNPLHVFNLPGHFAVKLTAGSIANGNAICFKPDYIVSYQTDWIEDWSNSPTMSMDSPPPGSCNPPNFEPCAFLGRSCTWMVSPGVTGNCQITKGEMLRLSAGGMGICVSTIAIQNALEIPVSENSRFVIRSAATLNPSKDPKAIASFSFRFQKRHGVDGQSLYYYVDGPVPEVAEWGSSGSFLKVSSSYSGDLFADLAAAMAKRGASFTDWIGQDSVFINYVSYDVSPYNNLGSQYIYEIYELYIYNTN